MDEKDFELLRVLEESRNITKAAERLFMTQSALSKRIKAMEEELGAPLLLRCRQGVRFTPEGETVLAGSKAAARELERMRTQLTADRKEVCGTLRAGVSINYALYVFPDILAEYHRSFPKVQLQITTDQSRNLHRQMLEGSLDAAVIRGDYSWDGMRFPLSRERVCVIRAKEWAETPLNRLLYISRKTDSSLEAATLRWMSEQGLEGLHAGLSVDSITTCVEMVRRGLGWSVVPEIALRDFDGCVEPCAFENGEPFVRETALICRRERLRLPQVRAFVERMKQGAKAAET